MLSTGSLTFQSSGNYDIDINGVGSPGVNYSQVDASGTVNLTGSTLNLVLNHKASLSGSFDILENTSGNAIVGTFNGLPAGSMITSGGYQFYISYTGGASGRDVVLTIGTSTSLTLTSSNLNSAVYGQTLTLTAIVTPTASGTVTFTDTTTNTVLASNVAVSSSGQATITTSSFAVGTNNITAVFTSSNPAYSNSTAVFSQTINQASTTTALTSSANPSNFGSTVTFIAAVSPATPGSGVPTGTVSFYDSGNLLMTETLSSGEATYTTSTLAVGSHSITATYNANTDFLGSSTANAINQVVKSSSSPSVVGGVVVNSGQGSSGSNTYLGNSRVLSLQLTFSAPIDDTPALKSAFSLTRAGLPNGLPGDGATIGTITPTLSANSTVITLTFSGINTEGNSIGDGNWTLNVNGSDITSGGVPMSGNYTETGILRLYGDYDGTGTVDSTDLGVLGTTYGLTSTSPAYIEAFDSDGNREIDSTDLGRFGTNFGLSI